MRGLFVYLLFPVISAAQVTGSSIGGTIRADNGEVLIGATIKIIHQPTGTIRLVRSGRKGGFIAQNLFPGGPYSLEASFIGYKTERQQDIFIRLGEDFSIDLSLMHKNTALQQVTVLSARRNAADRRYTGNISWEKMEKIPSAGKNMYDYLKSIPHANLVQGNEGAISFAGQNNRYNSFYVDGSIYNDVFGLSASGTNNGQSSVSPLPADAIEQFQVAVSPYDASIGNFTGAAVNAVTRAGSNKPESAVYYFSSNQSLTGKTPDGAKEDAVRLNDFYTKNYGFRTQGAVQQNRLFYFVNIELQRDRYAQPFSFIDYRGDTKDQRQLGILANTLRAVYHYDPGSFLDNPVTVNADKMVLRADWNINNKNTLTASSRYLYAQRTNTNPSEPLTIHFSNDGHALFSYTHSFTLEWKAALSNHCANKWMVTYTDVKDDREPLLRAFPRVRINDGDGAFVFGTDNSSAINLLRQQSWTFFDRLSMASGNHRIGLGIDLEHHRLHNAFIQNAYGNYTYYDLGDFLTRYKPAAYKIGFSMLDDVQNDHTAAATDMRVLKTAAFITDDIRLNRWTVTCGIRADKYFFPDKPSADDYTNDIAIPAFAQYWQLDGAGSGSILHIPLSISPRMGFRYLTKDQKKTLSGGLGIFSGRLPFAWPGGVYANNGISIGGFSASGAQLNKIRFNPDPYHQWMPAEFNAAPNKEPLNLLSADFSMPALFRTSLGYDTRIRQHWSTGLEIIFSRNLSEIKYTNINLLPPVNNAIGPDTRPVYNPVNNVRIPLNRDSTNPYDYAILLSNNKSNTGYAYDLIATLSGHWTNGWDMDLNYHFGRSFVNNEGTSSVNLSQWRTMESVNGRNFLTRSVSDFSPGHRIVAMVTKNLPFHNQAMNMVISLVYTGRSGSPVSFVYGNQSMTRDDGPFGAYDLIYIPTRDELDAMVFLPNTVNKITYSPQEQKDALERYINADPYLKKHRGAYAERNGSRLPFTHSIDLRIRHNIRVGRNEIQLTCDLVNFTNFLNRDWGRRYDQPEDHLPLIDFAGYRSESDLTPQFRFDPNLLADPKWPVSRSTTPAYSPRWTTILGVRIILK